MRKGLPLIWAASILLWATSAMTQESPVECPGTSMHVHLELLEHAALADLAYGKIGPHRFNPFGHCLNDARTQSPITLTVQSLKPLLSFLPDRQDYPAKILVDGSTGEEWITCNRKEPIRERLAIAFRFVLNNRKVSLLAKAAIVGGAVQPREEIRVVRLRPEDSNDMIYGVQGTDILRLLPQLSSSIWQLIKESCGFSLAIEVAERFFGMHKAREFRHVIVGHSLGGAVAQHVAMSPKFAPRHGGERLDAAYSFNSIGSAASTEILHPERIFSVRLAGELLEDDEANLGRLQIGQVYRYAVPPPHMSGITHRIQRHKIWKVQEEICSCLYGTGRFEYSSPRE